MQKQFCARELPLPRISYFVTVLPLQRKQRVIKFAIKGNASAFRPLSFRIKNEETKIEMVEMQEQDKHPIQVCFLTSHSL
jgi:hypothetical protein